MFKSTSSSLILLGVLGIIVGIIVIAWPSVTVAALVILISIAFGVVLSARPDIGAVTLALLFGPYSLIFGVSEIVLGVQMRRTGRTVQAILHDAA